MAARAMTAQDVIDREEIRDVITRYTRYVDAGAAGDPWHHIFTEDAILDYSRTDGPSADPATTLAWVLEMRSLFVAWQHVIGQVDITLDGDSASATAYFVNPIVATQPDGTTQIIEVGGYYYHELTRTPAGWRSRHLIDELVWTR